MARLMVDDASVSYVQQAHGLTRLCKLLQKQDTVCSQGNRGRGEGV
jgi:hypothetical protein